MKVICDTGPLYSAADRRDPAQRLAATLISTLGRDLLIPEPVVTELDYLFRKRLTTSTARSFLSALSRGEYQVMFLTPRLMERAVEIDALYADLDLGYADASVMACAERHDLPIFTFDFRDYRATAPQRGEWRLLIDEAQYRAATRG